MQDRCSQPLVQCCDISVESSTVHMRSQRCSLCMWMCCMLGVCLCSLSVILCDCWGTWEEAVWHFFFLFFCLLLTSRMIQLRTVRPSGCLLTAGYTSIGCQMVATVDGHNIYLNNLPLNTFVFFTFIPNSEVKFSFFGIKHFRSMFLRYDHNMTFIFQNFRFSDIYVSKHGSVTSCFPDFLLIPCP